MGKNEWRDAADVAGRLGGAGFGVGGEGEGVVAFADGKDQGDGGAGKKEAGKQGCGRVERVSVAFRVRNFKVNSER